MAQYKRKLDLCQPCDDTTSCMEKTIPVVAALCFFDEQLLLAKRSTGRAFPGLWEFPGGKVELGEEKDNALFRELREELELAASDFEAINETQTFKPFGTNSYSYPDRLVLIDFFLAKLKRKPTATHSHSEIKFFTQDELARFFRRSSGANIIPPDVPIVQDVLSRWENVIRLLFVK